MKDQIFAAYALTLKHLGTSELASLHLALSGFGFVQPLNVCYEVACEYNLIDGDGRPHDEHLLEAVQAEVEHRIAAGTYQ